jgi:hypothetical protein
MTGLGVIAVGGRRHRCIRNSARTAARPVAGGGREGSKRRERLHPDKDEFCAQACLDAIRDLLK